MASVFYVFLLEKLKPLSIRNISRKIWFGLIFTSITRHKMTKWLQFFLAFYLFVGQPALLWRMLENNTLYQLAWFNAGVFFIACIISSMWCKSTYQKKSGFFPSTCDFTGENQEEKSELEQEDLARWVIEIEEVTEIEGIIEVREKQDEQPELNEEKEEKKVEKIIKESVTIPKIVQPITWHVSTKRRRKRESRFGQRLILLFTLAISVVMAWTLREFLWVRGIAVSLFLGRILYLITGKLFDINGFYEAKKLFTNRLYVVLILAWIGYWAYITQQNDKPFTLFPKWWTDKVISYVKDVFNWDDAEIDTWVIYIFEWTWEVITNSEENNINMEVSDDTWSVENSDLSWSSQVSLNDVKVSLEDYQELSQEELAKKITMWDAIKSLLAWTTLSTKTTSTFRYVAKSNELYPYFKTAQEKWMIWTDTDPSKMVSCETYITMKWLLEWRNVWSYIKSEIKSVYRKKATELWKLNGCTKWAYVTQGNL